MSKSKEQILQYTLGLLKQAKADLDSVCDSYNAEDEDPSEHRMFLAYSAQIASLRQIVKFIDAGNYNALCKEALK